MCAPTPSHVRLAHAMRDLRAFVDVGQERLASRMSCSRSRLSHFENAADLPSSAAWRRWLAAIHEVGRRETARRWWRATFSAKLAEAEDLYAAAAAEAGAQPTTAARAGLPRANRRPTPGSCSMAPSFPCRRATSAPPPPSTRSLGRSPRRGGYLYRLWSPTSPPGSRRSCSARSTVPGYDTAARGGCAPRWRAGWRTTPVTTTSRDGISGAPSTSRTRVAIGGWPPTSWPA